MDALIDSINQLKNSYIRNLIEERIKEFSQIKNSCIDDIFVELCFCIMTANCGAEKCIEIHEKIAKDFLSLSENQLKKKFKDLGYRFPNVRAEYIIESRKRIDDLEGILKKESNSNLELRNWIVKNIKGLGYKEGSHFLRNIGFTDYAIIDFHIIDLLVEHNLIERPKTLTKKKYLKIEALLKNLANKLDLTLGELDLYLWYLETDRVLK
ncbi:MAG: N-glycosylase/DNA lyase [Promethearchaeota archaeon]|nr:MAG: N-glycosylase/DNA lyase [Candidatus Lokiarchaeota archaeon]